MVAWPRSDPTTGVILVVNYISELTIQLLYVHSFCVKEVYNTSFIVNLMQEIVHSWCRKIYKLYYNHIISKFSLHQLKMIVNYI